MNASKENARKAAREMAIIAGTACPRRTAEAIAFVTNFVAAATRRLPYEASYKRDRERRRVKSELGL